MKREHNHRCGLAAVGVVGFFIPNFHMFEKQNQGDLEDEKSGRKKTLKSWVKCSRITKAFLGPQSRLGDKLLRI